MNVIAFIFLSAALQLYLGSSQLMLSNDYPNHFSYWHLLRGVDRTAGQLQEVDGSNSRALAHAGATPDAAPE